MNFIKETDRFARQLEAWQKGHGFSDLEALQDLANLWDEFKNIPERRAVIYVGALGVPPKTEISCGNCVQDMLQMVVNWRKILEHEVTVEFKGVPQAKIEVVDSFKEQNDKQVSDMINEFNIQPLIFDKPDYSNLKMHEVRSLAKSKGIEYTNKTTKEELIKALNETC